MILFCVTFGKDSKSMGLGLLEKGVFNARSVPIPHAQVTAATPPLPSSWSDRDASALVSAKVSAKSTMS